MKKKMVRDERVVSSQRKIQSDGFSLVWVLLLVSVLIQDHLFDAPISQYVVEMIIWLAMSLYSIIANVIKGNELDMSTDKRSNRLRIVHSVIAGLVVSAINTTQNYFEYGEKMKDTIILNTVAVAVVTFICATLGTYIVLTAISWLNNKRQQTISNELDNEE